MATISTIKPAGGGDYANLALWEADADDALSADQWAECYTGGDLGEVVLQNWATGADATHYAKIYPATGEEHDGTSGATGAYLLNDASFAGITLREAYTRIGRIRMDIIKLNSTIRHGIHGRYDTSGVRWTHDVVIDGFLVRYYGTGTSPSSAGVFLDSINTNCDFGVVKNVIVYGAGVGATSGFLINSSNSTAGALTCSVSHFNNTVYNQKSGGFDWQASKTGAGALTLNVTSTNNCSFDSGSVNSEFLTSITTGTVNLTQTYCVSSDASADDWGGAGNLTFKTSANNFVTPGTNVTPKVGGDIIDAGTTIASVTTDAIGTSRPQNAIYDIGAIEKIVVVSYSGFVSVITV